MHCANTFPIECVLCGILAFASVSCVKWPVDLSGLLVLFNALQRDSIECGDTMGINSISRGKLRARNEKVKASNQWLSPQSFVARAANLCHMF